MLKLHRSVFKAREQNSRKVRLPKQGLRKGLSQSPVKQTLLGWTRLCRRRIPPSESFIAVPHKELLLLLRELHNLRVCHRPGSGINWPLLDASLVILEGL